MFSSNSRKSFGPSNGEKEAGRERGSQHLRQVHGKSMALPDTVWVSPPTAFAYVWTAIRLSGNVLHLRQRPWTMTTSPRKAAMLAVLLCTFFTSHKVVACDEWKLPEGADTATLSAFARLDSAPSGALALILSAAKDLAEDQTRPRSCREVLRSAQDDRNEIQFNVRKLTRLDVVWRLKRNSPVWIYARYRQL